MSDSKLDFEYELNLKFGSWAAKTYKFIIDPLHCVSIYVTLWGLDFGRQQSFPEPTVTIGVLSPIQ